MISAHDCILQCALVNKNSKQADGNVRINTLTSSGYMIWEALSRNVNKRPVDTLVGRPSVAQTGAGVEPDRVAGRGAHVLEIDALF